MAPIKDRGKEKNSSKENIQKKKLFLYSPRKVRSALAAIENGTSVLKASKTYGVPRTTLRRKVRGEAPPTSGHVGPESVLGSKIEDALFNWLLETSRMGFPINKDGLLYSVKKLVDAEDIKTPFKDNTPGRKWFDGFMKRQPQLSQKKSEYLSRTRAAVNENFIRRWFREVEELLVDSEGALTDPRRVFNMDETAMCLAPKGGIVLAEKGRAAYDVSSSSDKENITTLFTVNAAGEIAPPLTVFKYERLPKTCVDNAPKGWGLGKTENGWMTSVAFYEYFANVFLPHLQEKNITMPVIVFLDGHVSHMSYHLSSSCKEHKIIICCLPPNATHILQPLDVSFFAPLKKQWRNIARNWRIHHDGLDLHKFDVPNALSDIIQKTSFEDAIKAGFRCCGLFPFNADAINHSKCLQQTRDCAAANNTQEAESSRREPCISVLKHLEKNIDTKILQQFKNLKNDGSVWNGDVQYSALFETWSKIHNEIYGTTESLSIEPVDDTVMLLFPELTEILKASVPFTECVPVIDEADIGEPVLIELVTGVDNSTMIIQHPHDDPVPIMPTNHPISDSDAVIASGVEDNIQSEATIISNEQEGINSETDSAIVFNSATTAGTALKEILVWPEPKITKKKQVQKERLPSVITSEKWLEIMKVKEVEKHVKLEKQAKRKLAMKEKSEKLKKIKIEKVEQSSSQKPKTSDKKVKTKPEAKSTRLKKK